MAAKRTLGLIYGLTLASVMAGCASQTPGMSKAQPGIPNNGPAIIEADAIFIPSADRKVQAAGETVAGQRWTAQDFDTLPKRIEAAGAAAAGLIPGPTLSSLYPGCSLNFPGLWPGSWAGGLGFCPAPYGFAFGTPGIFPKTLFISPDVYFYRRDALYFPYSRLGGYFYPITVPYGARFYTPFLAYTFGGFSPYTFTSGTCPIGQPFPGALPCGPGIGGPGIGGPGIGGPGYGGPGMGGPEMGGPEMGEPGEGEEGGYGGGYGGGGYVPPNYGKGKHHKHAKGAHMGNQMGGRRY